MVIDSRFTETINPETRNRSIFLSVRIIGTEIEYISETKVCKEECYLKEIKQEMARDISTVLLQEVLCSYFLKPKKKYTVEINEILIINTIERLIKRLTYSILENRVTKIYDIIPTLENAGLDIKRFVSLLYNHNIRWDVSLIKQKFPEEFI